MFNHKDSPWPRAALGKGLGAGLGALLIAALPAAAHAQSQGDPDQTAPAKTGKKPAPNTDTKSQTAGDTTTVTVTAGKPIVEHKIDRDIYDVKQDPLAATGSAADVLNNVPAVSVDADGNPSLRGNPNVKIYINGKPSAQMSAENRAMTLQNMAASDIDVIEVMPNPPASFSADSSGGIINIITKASAHIQSPTSINVTAGDEGKNGFNAQTGKVFDKLTLFASANLRNSARVLTGDGDFAGTGPFPYASASTSYRKFRTQFEGLALSADYRIDALQDISGDLTYSGLAGPSTGATRYMTTNALGASDWTMFGDNGSRQHTLDADLTYDRRSKSLGGESFKMRLRHSQAISDSASADREVYDQPPTPDVYFDFASNSRTVIDDFSGDWVHPLDSGGARQFSTGWDLQHTTTQLYHYGSLRHALGQPDVADPQNTNRFDIPQTLASAYFIYQTPITSKLEVSAGLRAEDLHQALDQVTSGQRYTNDYVTWSPSVFFRYLISPRQTLRLQYGHKILRPSAYLLNPFLHYEGGLDASSGNPHLRPSQSDTYELDYNWDTPNFSLGLDPYYKLSKRTIASGKEPLPGQTDVVLTTPLNSGKRKDAGLQYDARILRLLKQTLQLSVSGFWQYSVLDGRDLLTQLPVERKGPNAQAHLSLTVTPQGFGGDSYTVQAMLSPKFLFAEGYMTATQSWTVSYRHTFIPRKLVLSVNAADVLNSQNRRMVTETNQYASVGDTFDHGASFMVSLMYTFGQAQVRPVHAPLPVRPVSRVTGGG